MVTTKSALESGASQNPFPNSNRVYVQGKRVRVPMREINQSPTRNLAGELEPNEPVRVYDTSGPWGDPDAQCSVDEGLAALRHDWILERGDVEEIDGRVSRPEDDGFFVHPPRGSIAGHGTQPTSGISRSSPQTVAREGSSCNSTLVRAAGHCDARDGVHRHSRKSWAQASLRIEGCGTQ